MADFRRRNSLRYQGYDYAQSGAVFVTICTHGRQALFGEVANGVVHASPVGAQAKRRWEQIPARFPGVMIDGFIVMPDHIHGILLTGTDPDIGTAITSGDIVRWFKSALYGDYPKGVRNESWPRYNGRLWQRAYFDHIIRNEYDLERIRGYIENNPSRWQEKFISQNP